MLPATLTTPTVLKLPPSTLPATDIFHSKDEIYQYVSSSIMTSPQYNPIDDLTPE